MPIYYQTVSLRHLFFCFAAPPLILPPQGGDGGGANQKKKTGERASTQAQIGETINYWV